MGGIAYVKHGNITIYKRPKPAHKLRFCVPNGTSAVMGHTRFTTQGSEKFNYNNHPFYGNTDRKFAFAHNGVLYNDKIIRERFQLPETKIETDSYVAVQLLEQCGKLNFDSLKDMAETVSGNFTFTILDEKNTLYFVKGSSPLYLLHFKKLGIYVYASTPSIMKEALELCHFPKSKYEVVKVSDGEILRIDSDGGNRKGSLSDFLRLVQRLQLLE